MSCPRCGARVAPCDGCDRLTTLGDGGTRCCARCGALRIEGDAMRASMALEPTWEMDAEMAMEISIEVARDGVRGCVRAKREECARLERETRARSGDGDAAMRQRSNSTPTDDENGTPADDERRLTLSSVQCGQRVVPESIFKTPAPSRLGLGFATLARSTTSPVGCDDRVKNDAVQAKIVRLKGQILFGERATRKRRRTVDEYTWLEHDMLSSALRRANHDASSARKLMELSSSFLEDAPMLRMNLTRSSTLRTAIECLERDVKLLTKVDDKSLLLRDPYTDPYERLWPGETRANDIEPGVELLGRALRARSEWADRKASERGATHSKRLREITRAQNDLLATAQDGTRDCEVQAARKSIKILISLYRTMYRLTCDLHD